MDALDEARLTYDQYFKRQNDSFKLAGLGGFSYEAIHRKINNNWIWLLKNNLNPKIYTGLAPSE